MTTATFLVGKGTIGKSVLARFFAYRDFDSGKLALIDADFSNQSLAKYCRDDVIKCEYSSEDAVLEWLRKDIWPLTATKSILVDLGGSRETVLKRLAVGGALQAMAAKGGVTIQVIGFLNQIVESLSPVVGAFSATPGARHVLVLNYGLCHDDPDLARREMRDMLDHPKYQELSDKFGCLVMPKCPFLMDTQRHRLNFSQIAAPPTEASGVSTLGPWEASTIMLWLDEMATIFAGVKVI